MEGKLRILYLFVLLNYAYSSPHGSSVKKDAKNHYSKPLSLVLRSNENPSEDEENEDQPEPVTENINDLKRYAGNGLYERPVLVGDTFTPGELLPVTKKLIEKVDHPGEGKGIVSSAQSPEELADKLFGAFFVTQKRIVKLNERDISGLNALQALALSGEVTVLRELKYQTTKAPPDAVTVSYRGQTISIDPVTSKYRLLTKKDNKMIRKVFVRRGGNLAQKLWHNRHLIVNPGRKHNIAYKLDKNPERSSSEREKSKTKGSKRQGSEDKGSEKYCHWRYHCVTPNDLDTCDLRTECNKDTPVVEFHGIPHLPDENTLHMKEFRKMIGITLVDEEVEKILEKRLILLGQSSENQPAPDLTKLESLSEYFNNIIMKDFMKSTIPMQETTPSSDAIRSDEQKNIEHMAAQSEKPDEDQESVNKDGRRNAETPTRSTPKPSDHNL